MFESLSPLSFPIQFNPLPPPPSSTPCRPHSHQDKCSSTYKAFLKCIVQTNYVAQSDTFSNSTNCEAQYNQTLKGCRGTTWALEDAYLLDPPASKQIPAFASVVGFSAKYGIIGYYVVPKVSGAKIYKIDCAVASRLAQRVQKCAIPRLDSTASNFAAAMVQCAKELLKEHEWAALTCVFFLVSMMDDG